MMTGFGEGALDKYWAALKEKYRERYSEVAADHMVYPRNTEELTEHSCFGLSYESLEENIAIWLRIENNHVSEASFSTGDCFVCTACASALTELARGKTPQEALLIGKQELIDELHGLPEDDHECAELAVKTLQEALNNYLATES
ncbi:MAG: iron-sulfur cluster assembly scaffold protein [Dehalococcoidia bacterium]|nr:iron-sulfur cluster assembly scaffold protein [Dehalococcoidia bacterium]